MFMKTLATFLLLCCQLLAHGQTYQWVQTAGSSLPDEGRAVAVDASDMIYVLGNFEDVIDLDPGTGTDLRASNGGTDLFLQKLDASGSLIWAITIGGSFDDSGNSITTDAQGNVYICGAFVDAVDMDPGAGTEIHTASGTSLDAFVVKLDPSGTFLWAKSFGSTTWNDAITAVATDDLSNVVISGYFRSSVDFNSGAGTDNHTSNGGDDVFITKLSAAGVYDWTVTFGGSGEDKSTALAISQPGDIHCTGFFDGTVDFDPSGPTDDHQSNGGSDVFVQKLDAAGLFIWAQSFGGNSDDKSNGVALDANNDVYLGGYFRLTADMDPGAGTDSLSSNGVFDAFVSKLDASGDYLWSRSFGGTFDDEATGIAVDDDQNVYATGYFSSTVDFDPGPGVKEHSAVGASIDVFVVKLNSTGDYFLSEAFGGSAPNLGNNVAIDNSGNIYIVGTYGGPADFDPTTAFDIHSNVGDDDAFVWKYNDLSVFGVSESNAAVLMTLYPNPCSNTIRIECKNGFEGSAVLRCYDQSARLLIQKEILLDETFEFDVSHYEAGLYFIELETAWGKLTQKLVKR
jgi:hypothetical protein